MQLALVMARPSLNLLTLKGWPVVLVTRGLLKIGCLRTSAWELGSVFTRPAFTFNRAPINTFLERVGCFLEFGGDKKPIDVMVIGTFAVDQKLDLIHAVSQDFLPRS